MELQNLTISKAKELMNEGELTAEGLVEYYHRNINEKNSDFNAFVEVFEDACERAREIDDIKNKGDDPGPLAGVPIAVKDNILIKGRTATAASNILKGYRAPYEATVISKLKQAGAIILGRTNMDEFAMGSSTEKSVYGVTRNPRDKERVPGGSSGGSAAAVAMDGALAALGSDTGGSIRQPASFCGIVGLKPTYGSVSRYGLIAMGSSLDVIGPLTKTAADAKIVYEAIKGKDERDSTSVSEDDYLTVQDREKNIIGVPSCIYEDEIDEKVMEKFKGNLKLFEDRGHKVIDVELPNLKYALAVYYIIMPAEASTNLARFDGVKYGAYSSGEDLMEDYLKTRGENFGEEVRRRMLLGTYVLSAGYYDAYYRRAALVRDLVRKDYRQAFKQADVIVTPTAPDVAFKVGEKADPLSMYLTDVFTVPSNLVGLPSISVPGGEIQKEGVSLPVGIQFSAPHMGENRLFSIAQEVEGQM